MRKQIWNHLIHRCQTSKLLVIIYAVAVITSLMMAPITRDYRMVTQREQILELMSIDGYLIVLLALIPIIYILMIYKIYQDYKQGALRWCLLSKHKSAYVIGDILFLFLSILLLYLLCYGLMRYGIHMRVQAFDPDIMKSYGLLRENHYIVSNPNAMLLYPHDAIHIAVQLLNILLQCTLCVCIARYFVKGKKHFLDVLLLLIGILVLSYANVIANLFIQSSLFIGFIFFYYYEAQKTWRVMEGRKSYAEN